MQPNQLFHGVVVPRTKEAQASFEAWDVDPDVEVDHLALTGAVDLHLFHAGILDAINDACDSTIDAYEQESLEGEQISRAVRCVDALLVRCESTHLEQWLFDLRVLLAKAGASGSPVYWLL